MKINKKISSLALISSLTVMSSAFAAGTAPGTSITNTASLQFAIAGVEQTPKNSNTVAFVVDRKVNFILEDGQNQNGLPVNAAPAGDDNVYAVKVTNLGNATQDFALSLSQSASGTVSNGLTDNFNMTTCRLVGDAINGTGVYNSANFTNLYIDELAPDASRMLFLLCKVPVVQVNNDYSIVSVNVKAATGGTVGTKGADLVATTGANTTGVDIVFAEAATPLSVARDGIDIFRASYLVKSAVLSVIKENAPICDPINFNSNPKNIPGALVRYTITVANGIDAGNSALLNTLSDTINTTNLTFDPNFTTAEATSCGTTPESATGRSFKISCAGGSRACVATPVYKTIISDSDGVDFTTSTMTANFINALPAESGYAAGELKIGESLKIEFNAFVK